MGKPHGTGEHGEMAEWTLHRNTQFPGMPGPVVV